MTTIGTLSLGPQIEAASQTFARPSALQAIATQAAGEAEPGSARDAAIADLAGTSASVNALQNLNTATAPTAADEAISAAMPVSPLPAPPTPQTSQQQAQNQAPLTQDYYADAADDGDSKGA